MADGGEIGEAAFKALGVRHVPTTVARLKHVSVWEAQPKPEEFKFRVQVRLVSSTVGRIRCRETRQLTAANVAGVG